MTHPTDNNPFGTLPIPTQTPTIQSGSPTNSTHTTTPDPGRKPLRQSPDIDLQTSYGDPVANRNHDHIRIFFQNTKGLMYSSTGQDYNYYLSCIAAIDSAVIMGIAETDTAWQYPHLRSAFADKMKKQFHISNIAYSSPTHKIDPVPEKESFQSGGTVTFATRKMVPHVYGKDISDPSGLGRWSGLAF
jgi:hypothetical protein